MRVQLTPYCNPEGQGQNPLLRPSSFPPPFFQPQLWGGGVAGGETCVLGRMAAVLGLTPILPCEPPPLLLRNGAEEHLPRYRQLCGTVDRGTRPARGVSSVRERTEGWRWMQGDGTGEGPRTEETA